MESSQKERPKDMPWDAPRLGSLDFQGPAKSKEKKKKWASWPSKSLSNYDHLGGHLNKANQNITLDLALASEQSLNGIHLAL